MSFVDLVRFIEQTDDYTSISDKDDDYNLLLWQAFAGPPPSLPKKGDLVVYFPQGHLEYAASAPLSSLPPIDVPTFDLKPEIICKAVDVQLLVCKKNDMVYSKMTLLPLSEEMVGVNLKSKELQELVVDEKGGGRPLANSTPQLFSLTFIVSDDAGKILIPTKDAENVFPFVFQDKKRVHRHYFIAKDVHGVEWKFFLVGKGKWRHYLTKTWRQFVSQKNLVPGDTVVFMRGENMKLGLGIKRVIEPKDGVPDSFIEKHNAFSNVLSPVADAISNKSTFDVFYSPRASHPEFVICYQKYMKSIRKLVCVGDKFQMRSEMDDSTKKRCSGVVTGTCDLDPNRWPNSKWRCLLVRLDEEMGICEEQVSPWEIDSSPSLPSSIHSSPKLKRQGTSLQGNSPATSGTATFDSSESSEDLEAEVSDGAINAVNRPLDLERPATSHHPLDLELPDPAHSLYENALSMLNFSSSASSTQVPPQQQLTAGIMIESPPSLSGSSRSYQDSNRDLADPQDLKEGSKKRKTFVRWTQRVRVSPGAALEGLHDDGFSWRKYGQKDIFGSKYPRGYYRCTHKHGKGCLATKQVQRSDEDPTIFEIMYTRNHTCTHDSKSIIAFPPTPQPETRDPTAITVEPQQHNFYETQQQQQQQQPQPEEALMNIRKDLTVVTQDLDTINPQQQSPPSSSFPSLFHVPQNTLLDTLFPDEDIVFSLSLPSTIHSSPRLKRQRTSLQENSPATSATGLDCPESSMTLKSDCPESSTTLKSEVSDLAIIECDVNKPVDLQQLAPEHHPLDLELQVSVPKNPLKPGETLESLEIDSPSSLASFLRNELAARTVKQLKINKCPDLEVLIHQMAYTSLEYLEFHGCFFLSYSKEDYLPTTLKRLKISDCTNSELILRVLMIQKGLSLESLEIYGCSSLDSFPISKLPANLRCLKIVNCMNLKSLDSSKMRNFDSVVGLEADSSLENMTRTQTLELREFEIWDCVELEFLPEDLHNFTYLNMLSISNCPSLESFPEGGLPKSSLTSLLISECENLQALPREIHKFTSLQNLSVSGCPSLLSFPQGGLPPNLVSLVIIDCENLIPLSHWELHKLEHLSKYSIVGGHPNHGE